MKTLWGRCSIWITEVDYKVTGVVKEFPENSHFHFDFLGSMSSYDFVEQQSWLDNSYYTYLLLRKGFPAEQFEAKLPGAGSEICLSCNRKIP